MSKVVVVGDCSVGKTALIERAVNDSFANDYFASTGCLTYTFNTMIDGKEYEASIWDTAGQEKYKSLAPYFLRGALACIAVYSTDIPESAEGLWKWIEILKENGCNIVVIARNKDDLNIPDQSNVEQIAAEKEIPLIRTSAKTGQNVNQLFITVLQEIAASERRIEPELNLNLIQITNQECNC